MVQDRSHIFPIIKPEHGRGFTTTHCTDKSGMCWCKPKNMQLCPDTNKNGRCSKDCWRCRGENMVPVYDEVNQVFIIHSQRQRAMDDLDEPDSYAFKTFRRKA